jgi:hypothetical protein
MSINVRFCFLHSYTNTSKTIAFGEESIMKRSRTTDYFQAFVASTLIGMLGACSAPDMQSPSPPDNELVLPPLEQNNATPGHDAMIYDRMMPLIVGTTRYPLHTKQRSRCEKFQTLKSIEHDR